MQISYDSRILEIMKYGPVLGHKRIPRLKIGKILHEFSFFIISRSSGNNTRSILLGEKL